MSVTPDIKLRFDRICSEEITECKKSADSIGTYKEKRLHIALKRFACDDRTCYEKRIYAKNAVQDPDASANGRSQSYIADVLVGNDIYEIQTGSLYPLKNKLEFYLSKTDHSITVIHPLAAVKWLSWIDTESGDITKRRKSPVSEDVRSIARDLYALSAYIGNPRLSIVLPMIELEEFRNLNGWDSSKKRGSTRYDRFPVKMIDCVTLNTPDDYREYFLPSGLPDSFTAAQYSKNSGIRGIAVYSALSALCALGILEKGERSGRSYLYKRLRKA